MFNQFVDKAKAKITEEQYESDMRRFRKRKLMPDETREHKVILTGRDKFKIEIYFPILDRISMELEKRYSGYIYLCEKFNCLVNINQELI